MSSSPSESVSLPTLYARALDSASRASYLPTINDETQDLIQTALSDLVELSSRISNLSLFSPNETIEDISTRDLVYLSVPFTRAEVQNRVRTTERDDRMTNLTVVRRHLNMYLSSLETYELVPESERLMYGQPSSSIRDAAKRREVKIKQYKAEKDIHTRIEALKKRRRQPMYGDRPSSDFDLIASLVLPSPDDDTEDDEIDTILRETVMLLLRLYYAQAHAQLESVDQEIELLRNAPPLPPPTEPQATERRDKVKDREDTWKIDSTPAHLRTGSLLDPSGKPLRPFTILPAGASNRARLQASVFGPGHRLPTMSIDEYLEVERQRGGIISGGGPQPEAEATSSEQLAIDAEMEGTAFGEMKAEAKRQKDEQWAQYKDANPRGAGNTMNRG